MSLSLRQAAAAAGAAALGSAIATGGVAWLLWRNAEAKRRADQSTETLGRGSPPVGADVDCAGSNATAHDLVDAAEMIRQLTDDFSPGDVILPPFPDPLKYLLGTLSQCQLATVNADQTPHLSLMCFSYIEDRDVLVMTSQRNTSKFANVQRTAGTCSVILNDASVSVSVKGKLTVEEGATAEVLRQLHAAKNRGYEQFIVGSDIAVISIKILQARVCNIRDEVSVWERSTEGVCGSVRAQVSSS